MPQPLSHITLTASTCTSRNTGTHLDEDDQLILIRLCVLYQSKYREEKKGEFWMKISALLEKETGKRLKDPTSTMKSLVACCWITVDIEKQESGTTQADRELTQALDAWIIWLDAIEKRENASEGVYQKRTWKSRGSVREEWWQKEIEAVYQDTALLVSAIQDMST
ncbi:hypothetical protein L873DRAFT_1788207 [Choiromyces venosus 120613-1]|uniref:Uncharacterized protein n=1 Tax=Choiromyces venosus 120613-1 TaxID=1336337 RepID=A0A3N4JXG8_9PEZI|nr:hypothetical protein L873DRAFT_1788207 [Choiromyces venosus 120613-1]